MYVYFSKRKISTEYSDLKRYKYVHSRFVCVSTLDTDSGSSPIHGVPFVTSETEKQELLCEFEDSGKPSLLISQVDLRKYCYITLQMPYIKNDDGDMTYLSLTDDAIEELHAITQQYEDAVQRSSPPLKGALDVSDGDFQVFPKMNPDTARELADKMYDVIRNRENVELHREIQGIDLDDTEWPTD